MPMWYFWLLHHGVSELISMINWLFDYLAFSIRSFVFVFLSAAEKTMQTLIIKGDDNRTD